MGREKSEKSNLKTLTPTKQKLVETNFVKNIIPRYTSGREMPVVSVDERESVGSPAKRSKLE